MYRCAVVMIVFLLVEKNSVAAPPPITLKIDCSSGERTPPLLSLFNRLPKKEKVIKLSEFGNRFDINSFCNLIHNAIPKAVRDGKFLPVDDPDQVGFSDNQFPFAVAPPKGFIHKFVNPKLKPPKIKVPKLYVPKLKTFENLPAPRVGSPMTSTAFRDDSEEVSSAERMERFKKGVQKMLHFVKVLGQIDEYLSERTRIVIDKLSKTFAE